MAVENTENKNCKRQEHWCGRASEREVPAVLALWVCLVEHRELRE